jgi:hypothetical protein
LREILVLRDDDGANPGGVLSNRLVLRAAKPNIGDMFSVVSLGRKVTRKRGRQLRVDEETHQATCKIGWSL